MPESEPQPHNLILQILTIEEEADELLKNARKRASEIISSIPGKIEEMEAATDQKLTSEIKKLDGDNQAKLKTELAERKKIHTENLNAIHAKGEANLKTAVDSILKNIQTDIKG